MITDEDVTKLKETFATKEDLGDLRSEFGDLRDRFDGLQEHMDHRFDSLEVKFDAMLGLYADSMQEHAAGAVHLARHDRQIGALAAATGTVLPE